MNVEKWSLATNMTTMIIVTLALLAAITYYFSATDLEFRYYIFTYISIFTLIIFTFFSVLFNPGGISK